MLFLAVNYFCCFQDGAGDEAARDGETEDRRGDAQTDGEREDGGTSQNAPRGQGDCREGSPSLQVGGLDTVLKGLIKESVHMYRNAARHR